MVLARDARDGLLQRQTQLIAGDLDRFLAELSASLRDATYQPGPLMRVDIPKHDPGETRALRIASPPSATASSNAPSSTRSRTPPT
ncbi:MAG: hypothetical protein DI576_00935 [Actinomyces sp.]|nr:MAG: hypothetical protein DI576_00935 [Actinomyces sp.]